MLLLLSKKINKIAIYKSADAISNFYASAAQFHECRKHLQSVTFSLIAPDHPHAF
jgi:hypothetical protein